MAKRYRVMLHKGVYYPEYRFLWMWFACKETHHGGGQSPIFFHTLEEAQEYIYQDDADITKAFQQNVPAVEVWSLE